MKTIKTDSLGLEILSSISQQESKQEIKAFNLKEEALKDRNEIEVILFEVYANENVEKYFVLDKDVYSKWTIDYKIEGVEL